MLVSPVMAKGIAMTVQTPINELPITALKLLFGTDAASSRLVLDKDIKRALRDGNAPRALARVKELAKYPLLSKLAIDALPEHTIRHGYDAIGVLARWDERHTLIRHPR